MGIRPNGSGAIPPVTPDNPETRYGDWINDLEDSGEIVGGVWKETDAKASAANQAVSDLAGRTTQYVDSTMGERDRIPVTGQGGWLYSRDNPVHSNHLARKGYVDEAITNAPLKQHQHTSADITDSTLYADSTMGAAGRLVSTGDGGWIYSRNNPTHSNHLARKGYVDEKIGEVQSAPVKSHTHTSADITDSVAYADLDMGIAGRLVRTGEGGYLYSRTNPTQGNHLARKGYVDEQVQSVSSRVTDIEQDNSVPTHTHVSADITDTTLYADSTAGVAYRIPTTGADGFLYSRDNPTQGNHLARKGYVDGVVNPLADAFEGHTHTSAEISDTALYVDSSAGVEGRVPRTGQGGWLYSRDNPTHSNHLARKGYVDDEVTKLKALLKQSIVAVPPANLADLPAGQVYLDTTTLTLNTK